MATKILGLDNVDVIKDYINNRVLAETEDAKRIMTEEYIEYTNQKIEAASQNLETQYNNKHEQLLDELARLEADGASLAEIMALKLKIEALQTNYSESQETLGRLQLQLEDPVNSIFSPGQLDEIINTALITKTTITDDMVEAPNVYATNLVALIAKFGMVKAEKIIGNEINGHSISSNKKLEGTDDPIWKIGNNGEGWLANGNISWDESGNVTFGSGVSLSFDSFPDIDEKLDDIKGEILEDAQDYTIRNLNQLKNTEIKEIQGNLKGLEDSYEELNRDLSKTDKELSDLDDKLNSASSDKVLTEAELDDFKNECNSIATQYDKLKTAIDYLNGRITDWKNGELKLEDGTVVDVPNADAVNTSTIDYYDLTVIATSVANALAYYTGSSVTKDDFGYIKIVEEHPLSVVTEYYAVQEEILNLYNKENSYYTNYNRFGSKTTYIGADGIYSGTITGDNITAGTIKGNTIQSGKVGTVTGYSGNETPYWKISSDGSGYLAKNNISWTADGAVTLSDNVSIKWGNVTGHDDIEDDIQNAQDAADDAQAAADAAQAAADAAQATADSKPTTTEVNSAITTSLSKFEIASHKIKGNLFEGKSFQSSTTTALPVGTSFHKYSNVDADGNYTSTPTLVVPSYISAIPQGNQALVGSDAAKGPAWQIRADGDGYLAKGAIHWSGNTVNISGSNVNINGEVKINGDAIMGGLSGKKEDLAELVADTAIIGDLIANKISAVEITTDKLNTTPGKVGAGTIEIIGNDMKIFSMSSDNEVVRITGSSMGDVPESTTAYIQKQSKNLDISSSEIVDFGTIGTVKLVAGYNYWSGGSGNSSLPIRFRCTRSNTSNAGSAMLLVSFKVSVGGTTNSYSSMTQISINFKDGDDFSLTTTSIALAQNLINTVTGNNNIYFSIKIEDMWEMSNVSNFKLTEIYLCPDTGSSGQPVNFVPQVSRTDLSASGIRYIESVDNKFIVNSSEIMAIKKSNNNLYYGFKLDSTGMKMLYGKASYADTNWTGYIRPVSFQSNNNTLVDGKEMKDKKATILICGSVE